MENIWAIVLALLGSGGIVVTCLNRHWAKKDKANASVDEKIDGLHKKHDEDIKAIQEEQTLIVYGLLSALKGLQEQGCNGPVREGIAMIEKHLNKKAHDQH